MLTQAILKERLRYDPGTGVFTRLVSTASNARAGGIAGSMSGKGYLRIKVDRCSYRAHRLAWLYMNGAWPIDQIDHRNGVRDDNRFVNLREATNAENAQNLAKDGKNTSGFIGASWHRQTGKWSAYIKIAGKSKHLGLYATPEQAHEAYCTAKTRLHIFNPHPRDVTANRVNHQL